MYKEKAKTIISELNEVFKRIDSLQIERFIDEILTAKKIILIGVGREGLSTRAFTMRLMHVGLNAYWIWDETTPSIGKEDLLIAVSGCGNIGHIHYVVERAKTCGARVAVITGDSNKKTPKLADAVLFIPAAVYLGTDNVVPSIQPMGNLFEQSLLILLDIIIMELAYRMEKTKEQMEANHRNLE